MEFIKFLEFSEKEPYNTEWKKIDYNILNIGEKSDSIICKYSIF